MGGIFQEIRNYPLQLPYREYYSDNYRKRDTLTVTYLEKDTLTVTFGILENHTLKGRTYRISDILSAPSPE